MATCHITDDDLELCALQRPTPRRSSGSTPSVINGLADPLRDRRRRLVQSKRDRSFESLRPRDQHPDAAPERVRGDPTLIRLGDVRPGGLDSRLDALPPGGANAFAVENG
jgi:hypothetical protein